MRIVTMYLSLCAGVAALCGGCSSSGSGSSGNAVSLAHVGKYSPVTAQVQRPRLGMTAFAVDAESSNGALGDFAADQMAQMLNQSGRFNIVSRQDFASMLERQSLAAAVKPGQLIQAANVEGVDYILVGSISNLTISKKAEEPGMVDKVKDFVTRAGGKKDVIVTATCGVGFNVIEPGTGDLVISNNSEFTRTAGAQELGIDVIEDTSSVAAGADLPVNNADREKVIRLAVDDAIRKSLPKIDRFLASRHVNAMAATPTAPPSHTAGNMNGAAAPASAKEPAPMTAPILPNQPGSAATTVNVTTKACSVCGAENDPAAKFCKKCGSRL